MVIFKLSQAVPKIESDKFTFQYGDIQIDVGGFVGGSLSKFTFQYGDIQINL